MSYSHCCWCWGWSRNFVSHLQTENLCSCRRCLKSSTFIYCQPAIGDDEETKKRCYSEMFNSPTSGRILAQTRTNCFVVLELAIEYNVTPSFFDYFSTLLLLTTSSNQQIINFRNFLSVKIVFLSSVVSVQVWRYRCHLHTICNAFFQTTIIQQTITLVILLFLILLH